MDIFLMPNIWRIMFWEKTLRVRLFFITKWTEKIVISHFTKQKQMFCLWEKQRIKFQFITLFPTWLMTNFFEGFFNIRPVWWTKELIVFSVRSGTGTSSKQESFVPQVLITFLKSFYRREMITNSEKGKWTNFSVRDKIKKKPNNQSFTRQILMSRNLCFHYLLLFVFFLWNSHNKKSISILIKRKKRIE